MLIHTATAFVVHRSPREEYYRMGEAGLLADERATADILPRY